jgi:hypothetical protein
MSYVYNVVIQLGDYDEENLKALTKLNEWVKENGHMGGNFESLDSKKSAGTKYPEIDVIWGGFNYLNTDEFVEFFKSLKLQGSLLTIKVPDFGPYRIVHSENNEEIKLL